ncbi:hypothetical protein UA75_14245 [Actinoalloteichus sp. GBA129-24]|uniref:ArsR family transcriptional regulator n=1 Tax=Actinoalloteichus fjordicus TaxID=1612552 RepID=A0AAC9LEL3_9PSEU|nr:hypothetical protein UA74_14160 [Actinoalloteichus fjordicus]APU20859.1 hypothetical protein UA75_14245 [Actinoalloteichus sp. GBA129-24]
MRAALLDLMKDTETLTSTEAAKALGYSSGLCSFHLRSLARHGYIEEAPHEGGRARPWRLLRTERPDVVPAEEAGFGELARGLEDESHRRWLEHRSAAPARWQRDEAFSAVVYLTPEELTELGAAVRELLARYRSRDARSEARPEGAAPVAAITRLFPLIADAAADDGRRPGIGSGEPAPE